MKPRSSQFVAAAILVMACTILAPARAAAEQRFIVRTVASGLLGLSAVRTACNLIGCRVLYGLDGTLGRLFLVTTQDGIDPVWFVLQIGGLLGIADAEPDQIVTTSGAVGDEAPPALLDAEPVDFFGASVRRGYVRQPAGEIVGIERARSAFGATGRGVTVAVIDTGVDPTHPALQGVLLRGYDFTRGRDGGSELSDVDQSTIAVLDEAKPGFVNQSTIAVLDQSTIAVLDGSDYAAFGHGTMVAGAIHLVAPRARILPLKAFRADGSGYSSDVLRAIYRAVQDGAKVLNMSFSFSTSSRELQRAIDHATSKGVVPVASVGNDGLRVPVYPAALPNVIGVASTTNADTLSDFSNFGTDVAWVAAPGEAIVTTYPFGTYAAAWGTSFSAPFASGTAALLAEISSRINATHAHTAEGNAVRIYADVARGRLDVPSAVRAWREALGIR